MGQSRLSLGRAAAIALTGLLLAGCAQTTASPTPTSAAVSPATVPAVSASGYFLPASSGTTLVVTNANQDSADHASGQPGQWAWDFGVAGNAPFSVVAARGGTVIGFRGDSTIQCKDANTLINGTADPNCWTQANYVLIDQGDGTSGLYMHLSSAAVSMGEQVCRGQPIGVDGETGWATGPHVHFQVEATPSARTASGWWFAESLNVVRFVDPDVLRQNADGVPVRGSYVSANVATCQLPAATPPAAPTNTSFDIAGGGVPPGGGSIENYNVRWSEANPTGVTVRIYGLLKCLGPASATQTLFPCVTPKTVIPAADLVLIGQVAASAGTFTWSATFGPRSGPLHWAAVGNDLIYGVLITAVNAAGSSPRVIVDTGEGCLPGNCVTPIEP